MKEINIHEAKARLSAYIDLVEQGERILICRRNEPVAELRPVTAIRTEPRPLGGSTFSVAATFFDALPDDVVDGFYPALGRRASPAAETRAAYGKRTRQRKSATSK